MEDLTATKEDIINAKEFSINCNKKYAENKQEMDKRLEQLVSPFIVGKSLKILDAGCGIGHILLLLSEISPDSLFYGVDTVDYLIEEARKLCEVKNNISFECTDACKLPEKYSKDFDVSISWKTLSWASYYDNMLKSLFAVTKKHIFISSLFYDGEIDFEVKVREYKKENAKDGYNIFYNIYSLPKFKKYAYQLGAKKLEVYDFDIGIDLPKPPVNQMGTYTEKLENGKRIQISGIILMNWKIIRIDL